MTTRRDFIKKTVAGTAALSLGSIIPGFGSNSYQEILGANEKIRIGVIGVNSRGNEMCIRDRLFMEKFPKNVRPVYYAKKKILVYIWILKVQNE